MTITHTTARRSAALWGALALAVSLSACSTAADPKNESTPAASDASAPAPSASPTDDETDDNDDDATSSASPSSSASAGLTVKVEGQGAKALVLEDSDGVSDESTAIQGKLISGPGGCFAVQPGGQPQLLLIGDDTKIGQNPPTLTLEDGTAIKVGEQITAQGVQVSVSDVEGIPQQCSQGAADTAWVLQD